MKPVGAAAAALNSKFGDDVGGAVFTSKQTAAVTFYPFFVRLVRVRSVRAPTQQHDLLLSVMWFAPIAVALLHNDGSFLGHAPPAIEP